MIGNTSNQLNTLPLLTEFEADGESRCQREAGAMIVGNVHKAEYSGCPAD